VQRFKKKPWKQKTSIAIDALKKPLILKDGDGDGKDLPPAEKFGGWGGRG